MGSLRAFRYSQLGVLLAAIVLLGIFALAFRTVRSFQVASDALLHAQELRVRSAEFGGILKDIHANARSYFVTGDERALAAHQENLAQYKSALPRFRQLVAHAPEQREAFARQEDVLRRLLAEYEVYINLRRVEGPAAVAARFNTGPGKALAEEWRVASHELQVSLVRGLESPLATVRSDTTLTLAVLGGGLALDVLLVIAVVAMLRRDYRAREAAAAALQRHAAEIQDLYNHAPCGYHSLDADGRFVTINDTLLAWLGYARDEVLGRKSLVDLLTPASRTAFEAASARWKNELAASGDFEGELQRKDGTTFPAAINNTAIRDPQGRFVATRSTVFDLTQRKLVEQATAQARDYAESIVNTVREPLAILTHDLRVNSANRMFYQKFRVSPAEIVGRPFAEICGNVWAIPRLLEALATIVPEHAELQDFEVIADFPGIGRKIMLLNARKLYRPGNSTTMLLLAMEDVTESKLAEARTQELNASLRARGAELEAANRELEAFSYSVSHDLRAPLRHIDYFSSALQKQLEGHPLDAKAQRYLTTIASSARNMGQLIDDLLSFARIGRTELRRGRVRLDGMVQEIRQGLQPEINGRNVTWAVESLPEVQGDPGLIRQIFVNLLGNAVKYTRPRAEARIEVTAQRGAPGEVVIRVRDNGAGFDMKYADKLFGVFQRLHSSSEFEGTGVGLANVRRIVERHGGRIWAEAEVDRGATFFFTLPAPPPVA